MYVCSIMQLKITRWNGISLLLLGAAAAWLFFQRDRIGVHWDEPWQQNLGVKTFDYASGRNDKLLNIQNRYHGAPFEWFSEAVCRAVGAYSFASKVPVRRTLLILFFLMGAVALSAAAVEFTGDSRAGPLALLLLFCTPRIMAHAVFNTKDIPLLAAACILLYFSLRYFRTHTLPDLLFSAASAGLMLALRIPALYVIPLWLFFAFLALPHRIGVRFGYMVLFVPTALSVTYALWPVMWDNPISRFTEAWRFMSRFPWDDPVLYRGRFIAGNQLPADYLGVWMAISIPPLWIAALLVSVFGLIRSEFSTRRNYFFLWLFSLTPLLAIVLLKSVVYDEWRHVFFIYPGLVLLGTGGFLFLWKRIGHRPVRIVLFTVLILQIAEVGWWVTKNSRYPYLYFSPLVRHRVCGAFEQDYWGQSYASAHRFFLSEYKGEPFRVAYVHAPGYYNRWILPDEDKAKIIPVRYDKAEYLVTNHRFEQKPFTFGVPVFEERVNGCAVVTVYKRMMTTD